MARPRKVTPGDTVELDVQKLALDEMQLSNGADDDLELQIPYEVRVTIEGTASLLYHAYNNEAVAEKARAAKGSTAKKTDNVESYVHRTEDGKLGIPGMAFTAAIANAGRSQQDPRSPRKSMRDLLTASVLPLQEVFPLQPETENWDYADARRVVVQRAAVTRVRPAMRAGWRCAFDLQVSSKEYIPPPMLLKLINQAGRFVGILDFRPTFGRFQVVSFEIVPVSED